MSRLCLYNTSVENQTNHPIKKIYLTYHHSLVETSKKGKKLLFSHDEIEQPPDEVSQKKMVAAVWGKKMPDQDITDLE